MLVSRSKRLDCTFGDQNVRSQDWNEHGQICKCQRAYPYLPERAFIPVEPAGARKQTQNANMQHLHLHAHIQSRR